MPPIWNFVLFYLAVISLIACIATVADKRRAHKGKWRIPETSLLLLAALGGSAAMLITMKAIRHKIRKPKFMVGLPLILALQLLLAGIVLAKGWL